MELAELIVFAAKNDGLLRFGVDYWKFKNVTAQVFYPILRIHECIDYLSGTTIISALDTNDGYWQMKTVDEDREKWHSLRIKTNVDSSGCHFVYNAHLGRFNGLWTSHGPV